MTTDEDHVIGEAFEHPEVLKSIERLHDYERTLTPWPGYTERVNELYLDMVWLGADSGWIAW